jgi:hypothetical protein
MKDKKFKVAVGILVGTFILALAQRLTPEVATVVSIVTIGFFGADAIITHKALGMGLDDGRNIPGTDK